jgi:hypothetical protein
VAIASLTDSFDGIVDHRSVVLLQQRRLGEGQVVPGTGGFGLEIEAVVAVGDRLDLHASAMTAEAFAVVVSVAFDEILELGYLSQSSTGLGHHFLDE